MRVQQTRVKPEWVTDSKDPAASLFAWICGAPNAILVDDQGLSTKMKPLEVVAPDADNGIAFFAKDGDTLRRGFAEVADKTAGKREYYLKAREGRDLAALLIRWDNGTSRYSNQVIAALSTLGHNLSVAGWRAFYRTLYNVVPHVSLTGHNDRYQSVSKNVKASGRDGKMLERGVALFICPAQLMPNSLTWGRTYRQIGDTLTLGMMGTIVGQLSAK